MELGNNCELTIAAMAPLIRRRKISPVELTAFVLERISQLQPSLNAYITVVSESAIAQAKQAEKEIVKGNYRGALHGIPISLKDLFFTRGIRTTGGSKILRKFVPKENAVVAERLLEAGGILLGKTNLHEFAYGPTNVNPHYGPVRNPWDTDRISGGSSGGSAVSVISAQAIASLGTDTGGSIRIPSAACGCVGLKPSYGLVPLQGVIPLASSLDHVGPLCRCVADSVHMLEIIAGPDFHRVSDAAGSFWKQLRRSIKKLRVGVPRQYFFDRLQPDVRKCVLSAISHLEQLGADIREVRLRGLDETPELAAIITGGEALAYHADRLEQKAGEYGEDVRIRLEQSRALTAIAYLQAQEKRRVYTDRLEEDMKSVDVLAAPTLPIVAPEIGRTEIRIGQSSEDVRLALLRLTRPGNLTGQPAVSIPCGFSSDGLPVGLQLLGRKFDEATVLRIANAYEYTTSWHKQFPPDVGKAADHKKRMLSSSQRD
jgi:aspartyl-tRNA(Asn)/glutamyl-tRNA(Gln) amidotransferase subunit A